MLENKHNVGDPLMSRDHVLGYIKRITEAIHKGYSNDGKSYYVEWIGYDTYSYDLIDIIQFKSILEQYLRDEKE